ncbi:streptomycin 6-kinase [Nocardioides thalensis]|uniref:Streptomycin 6-kinase n=1 Tax=Nocardioides thalensis TaxID=1914755 RepID=A0A853C2S1_9ACTN|nr:aminoglycoside phosphotransferase family protein [Nocardioides thalensis]NYJ00878.1 streptomycin 6-kinase [Nocardioides thalensis]
MLPGPIPPALDAQRRLGPEWIDWLDRLPALATAVADEWGLEFEGPLWHGFCSLVAPVRGEDGDAVLKIGLPDDESEHEHLALRRWQGRGAVRLLRADPSRRATLLERLDTTDLSDHWDEEACEIVAGLYGDLHVPPMPQLREQASYVARWAEALAADAREVPVPRRLVDQAVSLARDLCQEPATAVIHADLHYENVLLAERDGAPAWVAIDPKPTNGDPHYEPAPMLLNRFDELGAAGSFDSVRDQLRRRFHVLVDGAALDEPRARDWVVVRAVLDAHWAFEDARRAGRALDKEEREHVTRCITVAKAVQD